MLEMQVESQCALHALNNLLQGELSSAFSLADLREGAALARLADIQAGLVPAHGLIGASRQGGANFDNHETADGNFSYQAVGRALGFRRCDWRGVAERYAVQGSIDAAGTTEAAFRPVILPSGPQPILGIFVHHGNHYTAMHRRDGVIYHLDSLPHTSRNGTMFHVVNNELCVAYATFYTRGRQVAGREVGGLFSIYYDGWDLFANP